LHRFGDPWNEIEVQHQVYYYNTLTVRRLFLPTSGDSLDRASFGRCISTLYSARYSARSGWGLRPIEVRGKAGAGGLWERGAMPHVAEAV
jgi:hypothetical protein